MPMYDYKCPSCGHVFEQIVTKYDPEAKAPCPKCQAPADFVLPFGSRSKVKFLFNYMAPTDD